MIIRVLLSVILLFPTLALAQEETFANWIGGDAFYGGGEVTHDLAGADDLFMAGEKMRIGSAISGSAHLAGRRLEIAADVGGDVYAAGMEIESTAAIAGDATIAGYSVTIGAPVGGDLRAAASTLTVNGDIGGYAVLSGDSVRLDGVVSGDLVIGSRDRSFGDNARVDGQVRIYADDPNAVTVPETVAPPERVDIRQTEQWEADGMHAIRPSWTTIALGILSGMATVAVAAILLVLIAPSGVAGLRRIVLQRPLRSLWFGFLSLSTLAGSTILFAMTLVGIFVSPAALVATLVVGFLGYVIGAYILGVGVLGALGRPMPERFLQRAGAAVVGAVLAGLIGLVPIVNWVFSLGLALAGTGALTLRVLRPAFFIPEFEDPGEPM